MEYVECRAHDTICIGERIRITVLERQRECVTLALVAGSDSDVRLACGDVRGEPMDTALTRYVLPLLTGDHFTVDDIQVGIGLYLDRREIAANDDCDIQLQISRLEISRLSAGRLLRDDTQIDGLRGPRMTQAASARANAVGDHRPMDAPSAPKTAMATAMAMEIRCLRENVRRDQDLQDEDRSLPCSP